MSGEINTVCPDCYPIHAKNVGAGPQCREHRLERALREIVLRTSPYQNDDNYPLASGVHEVASSALISKGDQHG